MKVFAPDVVEVDQMLAQPFRYFELIAAVPQFAVPALEILVVEIQNL